MPEDLLQWNLVCYVLFLFLNLVKMLIKKCDYSIINLPEHFCDKTLIIFLSSLLSEIVFKVDYNKIYKSMLNH